MAFTGCLFFSITSSGSNLCHGVLHSPINWLNQSTAQSLRWARHHLGALDTDMRNNYQDLEKEKRADGVQPLSGPGMGPGSRSRRPWTGPAGNNGYMCSQSHRQDSEGAGSEGGTDCWVPSSSKLQAGHTVKITSEPIYNFANCLYNWSLNCWPKYFICNRNQYLDSEIILLLCIINGMHRFFICWNYLLSFACIPRASYVLREVWFLIR